MSQITTHILDTSVGSPAAGVDVVLSTWDQDRWKDIGKGITDSDGRISDLIEEKNPLAAGQYRLHFNIQDYFGQSGRPCFYPFIEIVFSIEGDNQHYHVPLLLNPYGYSTYRGS